MNSYIIEKAITNERVTIIENDNIDDTPLEPRSRSYPFRSAVDKWAAVYLALNGELRCVENKLHLIMPGETYIFDDARLAALANA